MSEIKKIRREQDWADEIPDPDRQPDEPEKTYRDGSAVNECWAEDKENL